MEDTMNDISNDYFLDIDDDLLAFLEKQADKAIEDITQSNEKNRERAYRLLNLLLVGVGSSIMLVLTHINAITLLLAIAVLLLGTGWVIALYFIVDTLTTKCKPVQGNSPEAYYTEEYRQFQGDKLGTMRRVELLNRKADIEALLKLNTYLNRQIDRAIRIAAITPSVVLVGLLFIIA